MRKKSILLATLMAAATLFVACDAEDIADLFSDVMGNAKLAVTNTEASLFGDSQVNHQVGDTIKFNSVMGDAVDQTVWIDTIGDSVDMHYFVTIGSGSSLSSTSADVAFPFFGLKLNDVTPGTYAIESPLNDTTFISSLDQEWKKLLSEGSDNLFIMADDTNSFYIGVGGTVSFDSLADYGATITGHFNSLEVRFIKINDLNFINQIISAYAADPNDPQVQAYIEMLNSGIYENFFPKQTLNGTFECTRANVVAFIQNIQNN